MRASASGPNVSNGPGGPGGPSAVLLDMDGTLVDSEHLWLRAEEDVMDQRGSSWTPEDQAHCLGGPLERVAAYMAGKAKTAHDDTIHSPDEVGSMLLESIEAYMRSEPLVWRPGAAQFLRSCLAGQLPTALVTASWARLVAALSDRIELEFGLDPFDVVIAGDHVVNSKPHPEPYLAAAAALGVQPVDCLAIEDSPTGVCSAIAAGCTVVAVPHIAAVDDIVSGADRAVVVSSLEGCSPHALWSLAVG